MSLFDCKEGLINNIDRAEFFFNGDIFNVIKNRYTIIEQNTLEFKVQNYLSIQDTNKREVYVIVKSRLNFKSLLDEDSSKD
jgi:hypothetical protein